MDSAELARIANEAYARGYAECAWDRRIIRDVDRDVFIEPIVAAQLEKIRRARPEVKPE